MTKMIDAKSVETKLAAKALAKWRCRHGRYEEALEAMSQTHAMYGVEGTGMLLMGMPGLGKSSILASYVKNHLANRTDLETPEGSKEPIILVSVPAEPTLKTLIQEILLASSYQGSITGTIGELKQKLNVFIAERGVEMIIFDEFQHFLREQAKSNTRGVVNHIKLMMDKHKLAVVMAGTPPGYRSIAQYEELYQRFAHRQIRLRPFDAQENGRIKEFAKYIRAYSRFLERQNVRTTQLDSDEMLIRLYLATKGIPRLITHLLRTSVDNVEPGKKITKTDLARAFGRSSLNPELGRFNPFTAKPENVSARADAAYERARKEDADHWRINT